MKNWIKNLGILAVCGLAACGTRSDIPAAVLAELPATIDYNFHVKPILSDRCYACHGPDANTREAGLRLDEEAGAFAALESGQAALVAGKPHRSELVNRIYHDDPELLMPPPESNLALTEREKATLVRWIEQGAAYKKHWSFLAPEEPRVPKVDQREWVKNPIDNYVLASLEKRELEPQPETDPARLLRRVHLDLTGLPPTPEQTAAYLADTRPDRYERTVDALLETDAHAERLAMEWMDVARYADSHGLHADGYRTMYPWRDWVIDAFRQNMPYDQFGTEQLAGDLLPNATRAQKLATAFNRNHQMTAEGGAVEEEYRLEYVFDRVNTVSTAFLGMTVECAQCHDHKFDPISQREFFEMTSFFNSVRELGMTGDDGDYGPTILLPDSATDARIADTRRQLEVAEAATALSAKELTKTKDFLSTLNPQLPPNLGDDFFPVERFQSNRVDGSPRRTLDGRAKASVMDDLNLVDIPTGGKALLFDKEYAQLHLHNTGYFHNSDAFSGGLFVEVQRNTPENTQTLMGNTGHKNSYWRGWEFYLDEERRLNFRMINNLAHNFLQRRTTAAVDTFQRTHVAFVYDGSGSARGVQLFINGERADSDIVYDRLTKSALPVELATHVPEPTRTVQFGRSRRAFTGEYGFFWGTMDEIFLTKKQLSALEIAALGGADVDRTDEDLLTEYYVLRHPTFQEQRANEAALRRELTHLHDPVQEVMVMEDMSTVRPARFLERGEYLNPRDTVGFATPRAIFAFNDELPRNRLGLARWIFDADNPLTARVAVNRYWQMIFGSGLVKTPQDFGNQGALPTHPELLDYLAVNFQQNGWNLRQLLRDIVTSATYRQSSTAPEELLREDPDNDLLARGPSGRMSAEMIRDNALAASGLLVKKVGGKSVKPYQPPGLWIEKNSFSHVLKNYEVDEGPDTYRRSMYTFLKRSSPPPMMAAFDVPTRDVCAVQRESTNTPMQALILLNDPQFVETARALAARLLQEETEDEARLKRGFQLLTGRAPSAEELGVFQQMLERERRSVRENPDRRTELLNVGPYEAPTDAPPLELAALTAVANVMMSHDEFYTKR